VLSSLIRLYCSRLVVLFSLMSQGPPLFSCSYPRSSVSRARNLPEQFPPEFEVVSPSRTDTLSSGDFPPVRAGRVAFCPRDHSGSSKDLPSL